VSPYRNASKEKARLDELITLFGCGNDIAPFETSAFGKKVGELIARGVSATTRPKWAPRNRVAHN
jgi:hypothetical protein